MNLPFQLRNDQGLREDPFWQPYKLVSLWDMYSFHAPVFVKICGKLSLIENRIEMHLENADGPVKIHKATAFPDEDMERFNVIPSLMEYLELSVSKSHAEEFVKYLNNEEVLDGHELSCLAKALRWSFIYELQGRVILMVRADHGNFYDIEGTFLGAELLNRFSDIAEDATEAGNCFAVARYTACVFHLMRLLERILRRLAKKIKVTFNPERDTWERILKRLNKKISGMPNQKATQLRRIQKWQTIYTDLRAVKDAWRNPTMHPKATYSEEEARHILDTVKALVHDCAKLQ